MDVRVMKLDKKKVQVHKQPLRTAITGFARLVLPAKKKTPPEHDW